MFEYNMIMGIQPQKSRKLYYDIPIMIFLSLYALLLPLLPCSQYLVLYHERNSTSIIYRKN